MQRKSAKLSHANSIQRLEHLDSLRGLAALGIAVFFHYVHFDYAKPPGGQYYEWLLVYGSSLVDLFFVLSGFIFMHVYFLAIHTRRLSFKQYFWRRFTRLYPLHLLTLLICFGTDFWASINLQATQLFYQLAPSHLLYHLLFLHYGILTKINMFNRPSWTVSLEIIAYILFFILVWNIKHKRMLLYSFLATIVIGLYMQRFGPEPLVINQMVGRVLVSFFAGCLTYIAINRFDRTHLSSLVPISLSVLFIKLGLQTPLDSFAWSYGMSLMVYPGIIVLVNYLPPLKRLLSTPPLVALGLISYSMYLWHFPIQSLIKLFNANFRLQLDYSSNIFFLAYVSILLLVSWISYWRFEVPVQAWLRGLKFPPLMQSPSTMLQYTRFVTSRSRALRTEPRQIRGDSQS